eukprot:XP_001710005.1 Hypothetical protein GL50803_95690 [Giardia lamblia ATCC 50803]
MKFIRLKNGVRELLRDAAKFTLRSLFCRLCNSQLRLKLVCANSQLLCSQEDLVCVDVGLDSLRTLCIGCLRVCVRALHQCTNTLLISSRVGVESSYFFGAMNRQRKSLGSALSYLKDNVVPVKIINGQVRACRYVAVWIARVGEAILGKTTAESEAGIAPTALCLLWRCHRLCTLP